jgi:hypothetical protein
VASRCLGDLHYTKMRHVIFLLQLNYSIRLAIVLDSAILPLTFVRVVRDIVSVEGQSDSLR